jgi:branched-chain amino acid transport system permease protein
MKGATLTIRASAPRQQRISTDHLYTAIVGIAFLGVLAFGTPYAVTVATEVAIFALLATGLNILLGYTGLVSLGSSMLAGMGGYGIGAFGTLAGWPLHWAVPLTLISVAAFSALAGFLCTRAKGVGFLLITLALSQMAYGVATKSKSTGGSDGMTGIPRPDLSWLGLSSDDPRVFLGYAMLVMIAILAVLWKVINSPFGSVLKGIRDNEQRMSAMGYDVTGYKILAFVISSLTASVGGILQAQYSYFVNPESMSWQASGEVVLMVIIGGANFFLGPLVGSAIFVIVKQFLSGLTENYLLAFGIFFVLVVTLLRGGVLGAISALRAKR